MIHDCIFGCVLIDKCVPLALGVTQSTCSVIHICGFCFYYIDLMLVYLHNFYIFHEVYGFMVFNATFINISVISWRSVLMMEETGVPLKCPYSRWLYVSRPYSS